MKDIKVLVVDDSALMRKIISDMINSSENMEVLDIARNGQDMLNKLSRLKPDVITLDVEMPVMDGITALREMKKNKLNIPVIMISSVSQSGTALTMECLEAGAFDFIPKPSGSISLDIDKVKDELLLKIKTACEKVNVKSTFKTSAARVEKSVDVSTKSNLTGKIEAVVIGASTGGPKALYSVITALPEKLGVPVFIVQHMPVGFTKAFADRLNLNSSIKVVEASEGESVEKDVVYIAPGGLHMEVHADRKIHLNTEPTLWGVRPAVDKLFISASKVYSSHLLSIVLTGMGKDGAQGTVEIKKNGGITVAEDKSTCTIYGMPKAAYETGMVDMVVSLDNVAGQIIRIVSGR
ncbi:chemotaxis response regulator protein-glutamate methylesterase [Clostridium sp. YIM B02515]|uniref:Protein-glutamate methylesterase/protein-glutamine glutaminase n=1 Tax=Clostridium rhizosphaerae TaxID=2803861 RepID=A0ABS1TG12_9CLOT|nr:chemotaxis response regulator protein-glutamate methylesterase [Clostridium rhizosphaerae]MBL4938022.1 chemotaxis response regulator protein-glutamate methylesterase [Clostridium rhizosphaerae]